MFVQRFDPAKLESAYGIQCQRIYPVEGQLTGVAPGPFGMTYCEVAPTEATAPHSHHEGETFLILSGEGRMQIHDETREVTSGDVVLIPPFSTHTLTNLSTNSALKFVSVYWEERGRVFDEKIPRRIFLSAAPPTPNGELHLGHLSGPYIVADILRRFYQMNGVDVVYVCGSDDNQSYVPAKGEKLGLTGLGVIEKFVPEILSVQEKVGAKADVFLRPHGNKEYEAFVQAFFRRLVQKGHLKRQEAEVLFCDSCQTYLHEAFVKGQCPTCQQMTSGNGCEACGLTNDCVDLKNATCVRCGTSPLRRRKQKYYFDLAPWKEKLENYFQSTTFPEAFQAYAFSLLEKGLKPISASHPSSWGIPLPGELLDENTEGQVIYEWLEMAAGYVFMAQQLGGHEGYQKYLADPDSLFMQCFGFDNSYFYLLFVPALLMGFDENIHPPAAFVMNFFYLLEGKKFSTSRQHAIWGKEFLEKVHPDVVRYYLAATRPEESESDFTLGGCLQKVELTLQAKWNALGKLIDRLAVMVNHRVPANPKQLTPSQNVLLRNFEEAIFQAASCYRAETFSMNRLVGVLDTQVEALLVRCEQALALSNVKGQQEHFLAEVSLIFSLAKVFGQLCQPLMPEYAGRWNQKWEEISDLDDVGESCSEKSKIEDKSATRLKWPKAVDWIREGTKINSKPIETIVFEASALGLKALIHSRDSKQLNRL